MPEPASIFTDVGMQTHKTTSTQVIINDLMSERQ